LARPVRPQDDLEDRPGAVAERLGRQEKGQRLRPVAPFDPPRCWVGGRPRGGDAFARVAGPEDEPGPPVLALFQFGLAADAADDRLDGDEVDHAQARLPEVGRVDADQAARPAGRPQPDGDAALYSPDGFGGPPLGGPQPRP